MFARNPAARRESQRQKSLPRHRQDDRHLPRFQLNHIVASKAGGTDEPSNMQSQTIAEAKAKDRSSREDSAPGHWHVFAMLSGKFSTVTTLSAIVVRLNELKSPHAVGIARIVRHPNSIPIRDDWSILSDETAAGSAPQTYQYRENLPLNLSTLCGARVNIGNLFGRFCRLSPGSSGRFSEFPNALMEKVQKAVFLSNRTNDFGQRNSTPSASVGCERVAVKGSSSAGSYKLRPSARP